MGGVQSEGESSEEEEVKKPAAKKGGTRGGTKKKGGVGPEVMLAEALKEIERLKKLANRAEQRAATEKAAAAETAAAGNAEVETLQAALAGFKADGNTFAALDGCSTAQELHQPMLQSLKTSACSTFEVGAMRALLTDNQSIDPGNGPICLTH